MKKSDFSEQFSQIDEKYATDIALGAVYSKDGTQFRVWSPPAKRVWVNLYRTALSEKPYLRLEMTRKGGVWSVTANGDLNGVYYTLSLVIDGKERETIDPYAKSASANGVMGYIYDPALTEPETPSYKPVPKSRAVIYELHVRDFSADKSAAFAARGKYGAFCERGVKNSFGDAAGLDYLAELGITHVHLLPAADFASVDETAKSPAYNWGYDPQNFFLPEGSYCSNPTAKNGALARVREFKALVNALHKRGIGVIMDVVFNHVYDVEKSPLNLTFPDYYFRHEGGALSNGSGCGNEIASERAMARKLICDCLMHWAREYHIDGFRFDLMGLLDVDTLNLCAKRLLAINPAVILYGEGWTGGSSPLPKDKQGLIENAAKIPDYSLFSDEFRDCVKGCVFSDSDCGYINGNAQSRAELMKSAFIGGVSHPQIKRETPSSSEHPLQRINYTECHDNLTFWDKLALSMPNSDEEERLAADKLGAALILLAQGVPFIAGGQEFLRSKPLKGGFDHNSYKSSDRVNSIKWNDITKNRSIVEYYKGLIAIRKKFPIFRLSSAEEIREKISFLDLGGGAFCVKLDNFLLAINPTENKKYLQLDGKLEIYADSRRAGDNPLGEVSQTAAVDPISVLLLKKRE